MQLGSPWYHHEVSTDDDLLEAWREGDQVAGRALYERYFDWVRRFFMNKVESETEVEELVQETFMRCTAGRDRFGGRSLFRTYVFGIARNVLHEHYRSRKRDADFDVESVADLGCGPTTLLAKRHEQRLLLEGLRTIPLEMQLVLELYYFEDLTAGEVGEVLGLPENTVRSRIHRAKNALIAVLERLAQSRELLESTTGNLERWAQGLRTLVKPT